MKTTITKKSTIFFRGILRTSRGSVILVAVENMPIAPKGVLTVATDAAYNHPAEPQERRAGVGQSIYIGQQYDAATSLSYLNARYYSGLQGQFISQDPMVLGLGSLTSEQNPQWQSAQQQLNAIISNPQSMNFYSYGDDNPIVNQDPNGRAAYGYTFLSAGGEEGPLPPSFGVNFSASLFYINNPQTGQSYLAMPITFGATAIAGPYSVSYPQTPGSSPQIYGASGNFSFFSPGGPYTYDAGAVSPDDLKGKQKPANFNFAPFSASMDTQSPSFNVSVGGRPSVGVSESSYSTQTWVPSVNITSEVNGAKGIVGGAASAASSYYQSAISYIQTEINNIRQEISKL